MNKFIVTITLVIISSVVWAAPNMNEAAEDVCECLKEPYIQVSKAMELITAAQASGDMSALMSAQGEMMSVMNASSQCFEVLTKKYPEIAKSDELKMQVMSIADKQCPNPANAMSAGQ
jgi:hypothetical protein